MRIVSRVLGLMLILALLLVVGWIAAGKSFQNKVITWVYGEPYVEGKPMSYWVAQLKSDSHMERLEALIRLEDLEEYAKPAIPELVAYLERTQNSAEGDHMGERIRALKILGSFGEASRSATSAVKQARLHGVLPEWPVAADALVMIDEEEAYKVLHDELESESATRREYAAQDLARHSKLAQRAESALRKASYDPNEKVRDAASEALRTIRH
jgi:hypothetical protein